MAETDTQKQITSDAGGKLNPAQGMPGRRPRPRPGVAAPPVQEHKPDGLVVTPPKLARAIADGEASLLVKSRPFEVPAGEYVLVSGRQALGVVKVGERAELDGAVLAERESEHGITRKDLDEWAEAQPSWHEGPYWSWPVEMVERFDEPRSADVPLGQQAVVPGVTVGKRGEGPLPPNVLKAVDDIDALLPVKGSRKVVDVFCGLGALSLGFEQQGLDATLGMEMEQAPARVYAANRAKVPVMLGDCRTYSPEALREKLGAAEAVVGGVPCEPFSLARTRGDLSAPDPRRNLIGYALKLVGAFQPRVFCFENVWRAVDSPAWQRAVKAMERAGYGVGVWKLSALDFGTAQTRKRAFFVGVKGMAADAVKPPEPTTSTPATAGEAFKGLGEPAEGGDSLHTVDAVNAESKTGQAIAKAKPGECLSKYTGGSHFTYFVISPERPSPTVMATMTLAHWSKKRWLSARECARLQDLPDDYRFPISASQAKHVIGDAVPVKLAAAVAKQLLGFSAKADVDVDADALASALSDVEKAVWVGVEAGDEETAKIRDVDTYDPADASDEVLRDDFRILLAWYASWKKDPDGFEHDLETIESLLRKVLKELVRRGPDTIRFNPRGMAPSVRQFFLQVARDVKVPEPMFKAIDLAPDTDPEDMTAKELDVAHWQLHKMFEREARSQTGVEGWSTEDLVNLHARIVDKMYDLGGGGHPPPPDNGLDELSADFEEHASGQPPWYKAPAEKGALAECAHSGAKRGERITLADVLPHLKTFKARKPYVYLVGGLANHGETEGDVDILVNDMEDAPEWLKDVVKFRLGRSLPADIAGRLDVHFDRARGPFTNFVELYDLVLERVNLQDEVKLMRAGTGEDPPNLLRTMDELRSFFAKRGTADA